MKTLFVLVVLALIAYFVYKKLTKNKAKLVSNNPEGSVYQSRQKQMFLEQEPVKPWGNDVIDSYSAPAPVRYDYGSSERDSSYDGSTSADNPPAKD